MSKFTKKVPPPSVLVIAPKSGGTDKNELSYKGALAFYRSMGCSVAEADLYANNNIPALTTQDDILSHDWDLIVVPFIGDSATEYTVLKTALDAFQNTTIPVFIQQTNNVNNVSAQPVTGILTKSALGKYTATSMTNWNSRKSGQITFYGEAPLADDGTITKHASNGTNTMLWSKTVSSHPILMMVGYANSSNGEGRPWLGAQWMIDKATAARATEIKLQIHKRYCLIRWDGISNTDMKNSYDAGHLNTCYNVLVDYGIKECWLATIWNAGISTDLPDSTNPEVAAWFLARAEKAPRDGGFFRLINHETDVVNGTRSFDGNAEKCTSNNVLFDQFKSADYAYKLQCDQLTDYGFTLGDDGYGSNYPNLQNGNDMNNPAAKFLSDTAGIYDTDGFYGGFGCSGLFVNGDAELYPTGDTNPVSIKDSITWYCGNTLLGFSQDATNPAGSTTLARNLTVDMLRCFVNGGAVYFHGGATTGLAYFVDFVDEYGSVFTTCPDVVSSDTYEQMLQSLKRGSGSWFDL